MARTSLVAALLVGISAPSLSSQRPVPTAQHPAQRLVAGIIVTAFDGQAWDRRAGTAVVVGATEDSIYLVTAWHVLRRRGDRDPQVLVFPGILYRDSLRSLPAQVHPDRAGSLDLAVISIENDWYLPRYLPRVSLRRGRRMPSAGAPLLVFGCPSESCWAMGEPALLYRLRDEHLSIRSPGVQPGFSGGLITDRDGMAVGMVTTDVAPNVDGVSWEAVDSLLNAWRIPRGLPTRSPEPNIAVLFSADLIPRAARDVDGQSRLPPSWVVEFGFRLPARFEILLGFQSYSGSGPQAFHTVDGILTRAPYIGLRRFDRLPLFSLGGNREDAVFYSIQLMQGGAEIIYTTSAADYVDTTTGELLPIRLVGTVNVRGLAFSIGYRATTRTGVDAQAAFVLRTFSVTDDVGLGGPTPFAAIQLGARIPIRIRGIER
jgi:hypothetical protein